MRAIRRAQGIALPTGRRDQPAAKCARARSGRPALASRRSPAARCSVEAAGQPVGRGQVLGLRGVFLADPAEQVAGRLVLVPLAVELHGPIDLARGLEGAGRPPAVVELGEQQDRGVVVEPAAHQGVGRRAEVAQELAVDGGRAAEVAPAQRLLGRLPILAAQLGHHVVAAEPEAPGSIPPGAPFRSYERSPGGS